MEKFRNLTSHLPTFPSSSPSAKLSKAFKFNSDQDGLPRTRTSASGNPFDDGPHLEEVGETLCFVFNFAERGEAFFI